ncbi:TPA: hypothetical protein HA235_05195 [Candidatus Woesearchaeota archaeon]|nr:hypothetical protein [Candidatus Woesearchaeota archaeon]HIH32077.1 hypothetical protein [Candidatus Woesearchaeota archaeon]HIH55113.1 hypothetical protein [Candidatus Woesearchaeota archaeon]HIJ01678.1 hypothetical protein [Candidatus Woesearchaeota archaeon]HIJ13328.1 hypothetical protein [Candidatus Woesearchaeota archaeon]
MAKVVITESLKEEVFRKFKQESENIFLLMKSVEISPNKGKALGNVEGIVIKEIKYNKFRFYFITDGHILKFGTDDELYNLLIKFVRMSEKKDQNKVINEIKDILKSIGFDAF